MQRYTNWGTVCLEAVTLLPSRLFEQGPLKIDVESCKQISDITKPKEPRVIPHVVQSAVEKICMRMMPGLFPFV